MKAFFTHLRSKRVDRENIRKGILIGDRAYCGPEQVVIDLTNRCNNCCIACWTRSPLLSTDKPNADWHHQELSVNRALLLIDELHLLGVKNIRFTGGGEPFLHPAIFELIHRVKKHNVYCAVTTNFSMIKQHHINELIRSKLDELAVSIWASTPAEYKLTHPHQPEDTFINITKYLHEIKTRKRRRGYLRPWLKSIHAAPKINLLNVICNLNYQSIEAMYALAIDCAAHSIYFTLVDPIKNQTDRLLLNDEEKEATKNACAAIKKKNGALPRHQKLILDNMDNFENRLWSEFSPNGDYDRLRVDTIPCYVGWIFCRIMADGQVSPCCRGVHFPMGNINQSSFSEIWHSKRYNIFRKMAKTEKKTGAYFRSFGCQKMCDNFAHNLEMHNWLLRYS